MRQRNPHSPVLPRVTELAHTWVARCLPPGGIAIDATAGNGHDTVFLAHTCGPRGRVHAFDVQADAIDAARARVLAEGLGNVTFHQHCHSLMAEQVGATAAGAVDAVMFNLGYLPGGDKARITRPASTLPALDRALHLLRPGGIVTLVVYPGHPGGAEEAEAVLAQARSLDQTQWQTAHFRQLNRRTHPPELVGIVKQRE